MVKSRKKKNKTTLPKQYLCTDCGKDAFIGYGNGWDGLVKKDERICTACFQKRGGTNFFTHSKRGAS